MDFRVSSVAWDLIIPAVEVLYNAIHSSGIAMSLEREKGCRAEKLTIYRPVLAISAVAVLDVRRVIENNSAVGIIGLVATEEVEIGVVTSLKKPCLCDSDKLFSSIKRLR